MFKRSMWLCSLCSGLKTAMPPEDDASCWAKQAQRDQTHMTCASISTRMRKRRAFADKELENVMLERELRQRELQGDFFFSSSSVIVPVPHPPPLPVSPSLHCCSFNKDPAASETPSYVYKYRPPLCDCDMQFCHFLQLKSRISAEAGYDFLCRSSDNGREGEAALNRLKTWEEKDQSEVMAPPTHLQSVKLPSEPAEIIASNGSLDITHSVFRSDQSITDVRETSSTFDSRTLTATGWSTDTPASQISPHTDSVKSPHGSSVRTPTVRPLPFSVEALLRAWQANEKWREALCLCVDQAVTWRVEYKKIHGFITWSEKHLHCKWLVAIKCLAADVFIHVFLAS